MFLIVLWVLEGSYSVIKFSDIEEPRRDFQDYDCGEIVQAKFKKKFYPAKIVKKGDNQKDLNLELAKIISRCSERLMSLMESDAPDQTTKLKRNLDAHEDDSSEIAKKKSKEEKPTKKRVTNRGKKQNHDKNQGVKEAKIQDIVKLNEMCAFAHIQEHDLHEHCEVVMEQTSNDTLSAASATSALSPKKTKQNELQNNSATMPQTLRTPPKPQTNTPINSKTRTPSKPHSPRSKPQSPCSTPRNSQSLIQNSTPKSIRSLSVTLSKVQSSTPRSTQTRTPSKQLGTPSKSPVSRLSTSTPTSQTQQISDAVFSGLNIVNDASFFGDSISQCYGYNASCSFSQQDNWQNTQLDPGSFCNDLNGANNSISNMGNSVTDYYSTLDGHQKRAVVGFLECLINQFRMMDGLPYTQSSVDAAPSTSSTVTARGSDIPPRQIPLVKDPENEERFASVRVNPTQLRGIESKAGTAKNPGTFLLNKIADLIFTKEELGSSKGVSSLSSNKMEALQEYLFLKCKKLQFEMVPNDKIQTVMQNKICNARVALKSSKI